MPIQHSCPQREEESKPQRGEETHPKRSSKLVIQAENGVVQRCRWVQALPLPGPRGVPGPRAALDYYIIPVLLPLSAPSGVVRPQVTSLMKELGNWAVFASLAHPQPQAFGFAQLGADARGTQRPSPPPGVICSDFPCGSLSWNSCPTGTVFLGRERAVPVTRRHK